MLHAHPVPATRTAPFAQAHPRRLSLLAAIAVLALLGVSHPSMSQLLSTSGRWTPTSPGLDSAGVTGTAVHMTLLRGDDDWQSVSGHYHSYLLWYQDRHDLCGATTFFTGALYGWNPGYNANCSDSMMNSGFTLLPLNSPLDPGYDVFCSNTTSLADGRLLTIGGASAENSGVSQTSVFDRTITSGNRWTKMNPMATPRWYPGIKQMGDNSVVAYAGLRYARMHVLGGRSSVGGSMRTDVGRQRLTDVGPWDVDVLPAEDAGVTVGAKQPDSREYAVAPIQKINSGLSRAILFGGKDAAGAVRPDVWALLHKTDGGGDQLEWWKYTAVTGDFPPPGLWKHAAAIDSSTSNKIPNGRLWLACGTRADGNPNGSVYWGQQDPAIGDGRTWAWNRFQLSGGPGPRNMASYAYDARYNRMIVFGGYDDTGAVADNDVYALNFDATNPTWTKLTWVDSISTGRPPRLAEAGLGEGPTDAEHLNLGKSPNMYMYGGVDSLGSLHGEVWLMYFPRPTTVSWYKLPIDPDEPAPYPRRGPIVIRDHDSWNLRIFGGAKSAAVSLDTTWMIDVYRNESVPSCDNQPRAWVVQGVHSGGGAVGAVGFPDPFEIPANTVERITPPTSGAGSWAGLPSSSDRFEHFYPLLFALPNGKLFDATARISGRPTFTLDLGSGVWSQFPASATPTSLLALEGGSAVSRVLLDRTYEIMKCGSKDQESGTALGLAARLQIAPNGSTTGWTAASTGADTMIGRVYHNLVTLPNGRVLVTGGAKKIDFTASSSNSLPVYRPQIWNPVANTWTDTLTLAKETTARGYHSTALLMPDARVLTGGGNDAVNGNLDKHKFRVFCPPYHFAGNNPAVAPVIDDGPTRVQYNSTFFVQTSSTVAQVCLIRPGSVTHGFNPDQHYIELTFTQCGCGFYAFAPTAAYAPPGDYLLFLVNAAGVPSLGKWVRLGTAPTEGDAACDFSECFGGGSGGGGGGGGYLDGGLVANRGVGSLVASSAAFTSNALYSDNTLFAGSADGSIVRDRLALPNGPLSTSSALRVRLRHFGAGRDEYSRVRLVAIDHGPATDAVADSLGESCGTRSDAIALTMADGRDALRDVATNGWADGQAGDVMVAELGDGGDGLMWLETSGRMPDEGGIRVERETGSQWLEVAVVTPRESKSRALITGVVGTRVLLTFLGAHRVHGLGWFHSTAGTPQRTELAPLAAYHSRDGELAPDAVVALAKADTAWVDFAAIDAPAEGMTRDWFLEVDGRPVGYKPSAAQLAARHLSPREGRPIVTPTLAFAFLGGVPNPFTSSTRLEFELPTATNVKIEIFDAQGRRVHRAEQWFEAGRQSLEWNRRDVRGPVAAPGVYQVRLRAGANVVTKAVVVLP